MKPHREGNCLDIGLAKPLTTAGLPHPAPGERPVICGASRPGDRSGPHVTLDVPGVSLDYFARTFLGIAARDEASPYDNGQPAAAQPTRGPSEFLVIDRVERPSGN